MKFIRNKRERAVASRALASMVDALLVYDGNKDVYRFRTPSGEVTPPTLRLVLQEEMKRLENMEG